MTDLDAIAKPPPLLKEQFKRWQKSRDLEPSVDHAIKDKYKVEGLPGLSIFPSYFSSEAQLQLLQNILHRDLLNPAHKTNLHAHYHINYPQRSFFSQSQDNTICRPIDTASHKPIQAKQFLERKLRWMTLGAQYDWTNKVYPDGEPPAFPTDVKSMIETAFPLKAEAAIVNFYSPGDTLSLHRDVSEHCNMPLVSVSIGCDCIFVVGLELAGDLIYKAIRLKSGDAVVMSGESRFAWHGVPKIIPDTCPHWLKDWPGDLFPEYKGWMSGKRINLNVRQVFG